MKAYQKAVLAGKHKNNMHIKAAVGIKINNDVSMDGIIFLSGKQ